jgi:hypothetical protein
MTSFYELEVPTAWVDPPTRYSFSNLQTIDACPRKWQFLHSEWGEHRQFPLRQHPKALEGTIVHDALKLLMRALSKRGLPEFGSANFQQAVTDIDFWGHFAREIDRRNENLARHPKSGPSFALRTSPRELANRAIRLFREQYKPMATTVVPVPKFAHAETAPPDLLALLQIRGALSEIELSHPDIPFHGIIDLVEIWNGNTTVVDFKTGAHKEEHELQIQLYGLLWWRRSGVRPAHLVVQYLNERKEFSADEVDLLTAEKSLRERILVARHLLTLKPAEARPGKECGHCAVRPRCEIGWRAYQASLDRPTKGTTDVELSVLVEPSATGFLAELGDREVDVVYQATVGQGLPRLVAGDRIRVLDIVAQEDGKIFEIQPWTEVYTVRSDG